MALASEVIPAEKRTAGIAIVATGVGAGKLVSSIAFGACWQGLGMSNAILVFGVSMGIAMLVTATLLRSARHG